MSAPIVRIKSQRREAPASIQLGADLYIRGWVMKDADGLPILATYTCETDRSSTGWNGTHRR